MENICMPIFLRLSRKNLSQGLTERCYGEKGSFEEISWEKIFATAMSWHDIVFSGEFVLGEEKK